MKYLALTLLLHLSLLFTSCGQTNTITPTTKLPMDSLNNKDTVVRTEEEWKKLLSEEQYFILRQKGTERPFTGKYLNNKETGTYICAACGNELFESDTKFDSHCGWPSFYAEKAKGNILYKRDLSYGMVRTEIMCARCGGHLGHVFDDGPEPTGQRYCVNSISVEFVPKK